jgi:hypothetical protein
VARASTAGFAIVANTSQIQALGRRLRETPPELRKAIRAELRAAAKVVADAAKVRASWSQKIPGTIKVKGSGFTLRIAAGGPDAPAAVAFEVGSKRHPGVNRHPVFAAVGGAAYANPRRWVDQPTRPYLAPALKDKQPEILLALGRAATELIDHKLDGGA